MTELARVFGFCTAYIHTKPYLRSPVVSKNGNNGMVSVDGEEIWKDHRDQAKWQLMEVFRPGSSAAWDCKFPEGRNWAHIYLLYLDTLKVRLTIVDVFSNVWLYDHVIGAWVSSWYIEFLEKTHLLIDSLRSNIAGTSGNLRRLLREYRLSVE